MKRLIKALLITLIPIIFFVIGQGDYANAAITKSGNIYTVTNGNDLFNILTNSNNYWTSSNIPGDEVTIKVANDITLPSSSPKLYDKLNKINVDFNNHKFYVANAAGSQVLIPSSSSAQITLSNLNISSTTTSNTASNVPNPSGSGTTSAYWSTYYGILFSADWGTSGATTSTNARITYNNITYNLPNSLGYNQPLTTYFVPINFTGTNNINATCYGQQIGEIPNIKVSSGTTTITGGNNSSNFTGGMFYPYYNHINGDSFNIDVDSGATLTLTNNDKTAPMFAFTGVYNPVVINNNGVINLNSGSSTSTLFGSGTLGVTLNLNNKSTTNIISSGSAFSNTMSTVKFIGNLSNNSKLLLSSINSSPFYNNSAWGNGSIININSGAKLLAYSGGKNSNSGLTNSASSIPINLIGSNTIKGYDNPSVPSNADSFDSLKYSNLTVFKDKQVSSSSLTTSKQGLLISEGLKVLQLGGGDYNWNYNLSEPNILTKLLSRSSSDNLTFKIEDDSSSDSDFSIGAQYTPEQDGQPYALWFKNGTTETQLTESTQKIISKKDMTKTGNQYTSTFDSNNGLLLKLNKLVSGNYNGTVTWSVMNVPE